MRRPLSWCWALIGAVLVRSADPRPIGVFPEMSPPIGRRFPHPLQLRLAEKFSVNLPQDESTRPLQSAPETLPPAPPSAPPRSMDLSLDLTFVLLREALERAVSERLALQASTNQQLMEEAG